MKSGLKAAIWLALASAGYSDTLVVPNAQAGAAGNLPIALGNGAKHTQEVLGGGQFSAPVVIIALRFRAAPGTGAFSIQIPSFQITLSTTQAYPNTKNGHTLPSPTYAANVGPDATVVYNGPISESSPGCSGPGPCAFDLVIPFTTPFSYDPSKGRLLVDWVPANPSASPSGALDGVTFADPTVSTVATVVGGVDQPTGTVSTAGFVLGLDTATSTYYFPQLAFAGGWQTTVTYVNYSPQGVSCETTFYTDSGAPLMVPFGGGPVSTRTDVLAAGATLHQQTSADSSAAAVGGWAATVCSGPVKASILYRLYSGGVPQGEAGVNASTAPTTEFVTFAQTNTGIAYANPSAAPVTVTVTVLSAAGVSLATTVIPLGPNGHGAANLGTLLGLADFAGSVQITSTAPIVSLSLNAEAFPVFSALPAGDLSTSTPLAPGH